MKYFKGDTLSFNYYCVDESNEKIKFNGSKLVAIIYNILTNDLFIKKEFSTTDEQTDIKITFTSEEMKDIKCGNYILEIKIVNKEIITTMHESLSVIESWCLHEGN